MPVVIKRDGYRTPFDETRIRDAVIAAANSAGIEDDCYAQTVAQTVADSLQNIEEIDIHDLQDAVENQLMEGSISLLHGCILSIVTIVINIVKATAV